MAITIDYSDSVTPQYVINVPRADMTLVQSTPTEIRQLNINAFRTELNDLMDDEIGMHFPTNHVHTAPLTVAGVTLARVVEILDPYVVEFEDGQYNVNIVGGNSNISDVTVKNQVGVNTANSAGLQDPFALQAASFAGEVTIDTTNGTAGTTFPIGTRNFPSGNLADTLAIAQSRGINTIRVVGTLELNSSDFSDGYTFAGDSVVTSTINIAAGANVTNCTFTNATLDGVLDGNNTFVSASITNASLFNGQIINCGLTNQLTLGGGTQAEIIDCYSEVAGGGVGQTPTLNCGGPAGVDVLVRGWSGGLDVTNCSADIAASFDFESGRVIFDSSVSAGQFTVRGICDVTDNSTGGATVSDLTLTYSNKAARLAAERAGSQRLT